MKFALDEIEKGATFTRGQELDAERAALMPRSYVGRMLFAPGGRQKRIDRYISPVLQKYVK
jgi:hypothetical protein